ncbi:MAG: FprA family A-type flavoprotein [Spirochaetales bacterium]|nr:FprA family A-type flavoprotein [Spirochaetales bacterium]
MDITKDIRYLGVNDHKIDLFESQYIVPDGMSYNSYLIDGGDKTIVMDTVDGRFVSEWLDNLASALNGRKPDYLMVHHMEPDHSAGIYAFMEKYQDAVIVSSAKAFQMMKNFFGTDWSERRVVVKEGDTLSVGSHVLTFVAAPMVHWPEVMVTYDTTEKVLFTADGFGKFGALDREGEWDDEARRYYIGIVGKYGPMVQCLLKKASKLEITKILPLHGPVLSQDLGHYISLYDKWSSYTPEEDSVTIAYTSVYGHTREAVKLLEEKLKAKGVKFTTFDLARSDMAQAVASAFKTSKTVLATTTYNGDIFPYMREYVEHLTERNFQKRKVAIIENGSWGPMAAKVITSMMEKSKEIEWLGTATILSALNESSSSQIEEIADALSK